MTDKELKKLSRLELLELLLEESKENENLRSELEKLKAENSVNKNIEQLSDVTTQMKSSLQQIFDLSESLQKIAKEGITVTTQSSKPATNPVVSVEYRSDLEQINKQLSGKQKDPLPSPDMKLYRKLIHFFSQNPNIISLLPSEIQDEILLRIREAISRR